MDDKLKRSLELLVQHHGQGELSREDFVNCLADLRAEKQEVSAAPPANWATGSPPGVPELLTAEKAFQLAARSSRSSGVSAWTGISGDWEASMIGVSTPTPTPTPVTPAASLPDSSILSGLDASSFSDFSRRSKVWELRRSRHLEQLRAQRGKQELNECSFRPRNSQGQFAHSDSRAVTSRLMAPLTSAELRSEEALRSRREELEEAALRDCSFTPDLSRSSSSFRLGLTESRGRSGPRREDHSYHPKTNVLSPEMVIAQRYVQENVFRRLSSPSPSLCLLTPVGAKGSRGPQGPDVISEPKELTSESLDLFGTESKLHSFLRRQNEHEADRRRRLEDLEAQNAPTLRPHILDRSRQMVDRQRQRSRSRDGSKSPGRGMSTSLSRSQSASWNSAVLGSQNRPRSEERPVAHSFKPQISIASAKRLCRGTMELSRGDLMRREQKTDELRKKLQEEERSELTFAPKLESELTKRKEAARGRIRVLEEPEGYMRRLSEERSAAVVRRTQEIHDRIEKALADCTFRPAVNEGAPSYVRRLAEAYRAAKEKCQEKENAQMPDWR